MFRNSERFDAYFHLYAARIKESRLGILKPVCTSYPHTYVSHTLHTYHIHKDPYRFVPNKPVNPFRPVQYEPIPSRTGRYVSYYYYVQVHAQIDETANELCLDNKRARKFNTFTYIFLPYGGVRVHIGLFTVFFYFTHCLESRAKNYYVQLYNYSTWSVRFLSLNSPNPHSQNRD